MFRRLGSCAAVRQSGAVRPAAPAALVDDVVVEGSFKLSSLGASFLADRIAAPAGAPALPHLPFPMCFLDMSYPTGARSSFIIRPQRRRFFSTDPKPELPCPKQGSEKAASFVTRDDGLEKAKQEGCAGDVAGAKVGTFKGLEDHGGQKHPADDHTGVKAVACEDDDGVKAFITENIDVATLAEVALAKADASECLEGHGGKKHPAGDDQIGSKAFVNEDEDGVKAVDENLAFAVAKGDEVARAKAETSKAPLMNADVVAGAKSEAFEDGVASIEESYVVAITTDPRIKAIFKNVDADFLAGAVTDLLDGMQESYVVAIASDPRIKAIFKNVDADFLAGEKTDLLDGMQAPGEAGSDQEDMGENPTQKGTGEQDTGKEAKQNGTSGANKDELLGIVPATKRRFRRTSKASMNMAAHFTSHRTFVIAFVNKTSLTVIETIRAHILYSVMEMKRYFRVSKICKGLVTFFVMLFTGMFIFFHGVTFMVEELEAMYEAAASSEFTKNKAKEIMHHAVGAVTPLRMVQSLVHWPWFGGGKDKEEPAVAKPRRKRSFTEWLWTVIGGGDKK